MQADSEYFQLMRDYRAPNRLYSGQVDNRGNGLKMQHMQEQNVRLAVAKQLADEQEALKAGHIHWPLLGESSKPRDPVLPPYRRLKVEDMKVDVDSLSALQQAKLKLDQKAALHTQKKQSMNRARRARNAAGHGAHAGDTHVAKRARM